MTIKNNSGGQQPGATPGLRPHKVTNASSDKPSDRALAQIVVLRRLAMLRIACFATRVNFDLVGWQVADDSDKLSLDG